MTYAEFYDSFAQHPLLLWVAAVLGLLVALSRRGRSPSVRTFCIALTILSLLDAWLTTTHVPGLGPLTGRAASLVPLAFVLLGDFRYFLFVESARRDGTLAIDARRVATAGAWTLLVPVASQLVVGALGSDEPRVLFLVYELLFVVLALGIAARYLPRHAGAPANRAPMRGAQAWARLSSRCWRARRCPRRLWCNRLARPSLRRNRNAVTMISAPRRRLTRGDPRLVTTTRVAA
jgi:hypothetical protein